jgi:hypothetical protein
LSQPLSRTWCRMIYACRPLAWLRQRNSVGWQNTSTSARYVELDIPPRQNLLDKNFIAIYGLSSMTSLKSSHHRRKSDRRSRLDRRWIRSNYQGEDRRSGKDRRSGIEFRGLNRDLPVPEDSESKKLVGLENLIVSNTIQLEAVIRLLLEKEILDEEELLAIMNTVQTEYQKNPV